MGKQLFRALCAVSLAGTCCSVIGACGTAEPEAPKSSVSQPAAMPGSTGSAAAESSAAALDPSAVAEPTGAPGALPPVVDGEGAILVEDVVPPAASDMPVQECASADAPAALAKVVLAFVFDVSASMGSEYRPYDSRALKWDPVVAATKAFFADPASAGLSATITFFPNEFANLTDTLVAPATATAPGAPTMAMFPPVGAMQAQAPEVCDAAEYTTPDVPLTALPSDAFSAAIDAITPPDDLTWRLSTPTLPALQGTIEYLQGLQEQDPSASYTIVLVTDGIPQLCPGQDDINRVANAVGAVSDTIPTYVIGVENPATEEVPNPPPSIDGMDAVAERGGTGQAFVIDTTDPTKTAADFAAVINQIRESSFTCSLAIPPPPNGLDFNKEQVNVKFAAAAGDIPYDYDPECTGASGWRFDDEAAPTTIELCPAACDSLLAGLDTTGGELNVQFGCERRSVGSR